VKNRFIINTFCLVIGGLITKILGFFIKILYTRYLKADGVSLVTLVFPTYSLFLTISTLALPTLISKLIAEHKNRKSKILFTSFCISIFINLVLIITFFIFSKYFSNNILHDGRCEILIKILLLTLPFVSITSIIKAYFFGEEKIIPIIFSNISEEVLKLILILLFLRKYVNYNTLSGVKFYLLLSLFCEIISFIILFIFLPKKVNISKLDYKYDPKYGFSMIKTTVPVLISRLINSLGFFIEPILLTNLLMYKGLSSKYIILNYGYYQGYAIAMLTIPSFFLMALSSNIIPAISKLKYKHKNKIKPLIKKVFSLTIIGALIFVTIISFFGKHLMLVLYKTTDGYTYLKLLVPFFIFFYLESPIISILQSLDQENKVFKISLSSIIIKYLSLSLFILLNFGFKSILYSEIICIFVVVFLGFYYLKKYFESFFL